MTGRGVDVDEYHSVVLSSRFLPQQLIPSAIGCRKMSDPYLTFCIDNYLPTEVDAELSATFPDGLIMSSDGERFAEYLSLSDGSSSAKTFLQHNPIWADYVAAWCSEQNLRHCLTVFRSEFSKRYTPMWRWILKRRLQKLSNLQVTVTLATYIKGFHLSPHSDDKYKVFSAIHYLPSLDSTPDARGGTTFYFPRSGTTRGDLRQFSEWSRGVRKFLPIWISPVIEASLSRRYTEAEAVNESEFANFGSYFEQCFHHDYKKNRICGFVKNDWSMHEVDLSEYPVGEVRRSVLINIRVKEQAVAKIVPRIEKWLSTCKQALKEKQKS